MTSISTNAAPLLRPLVGLAGWTFVMELWLYGTRIPAIRNNNIQLGPLNTKEDMNRRIPRQVQWVAENYNHLHEQPTVFYGIALTLALLGDGAHRSTVRAAWAYVGLRVLHSIAQARFNVVLARFSIFATSSVVLAGLTARAASLLF